MRQPRWFKFGMDDTIELGVQIDIVNELVGKRTPTTINDNDPSIPVFVAKRQHKYYGPFYKGKMRDCVPYNNFDVPAVAFKYLWLWPEIEMTSDKVRRRMFPVEDLQTIENDFRQMIVSTNILGKGGKVVLHNNFLCPARNTRESCTPVVINTTPSSTTPSSNPPLDSHHVLQNETPRQNDASHTANDASFPDALRAYCLRCTDDCTIFWDMTPELASIELMFELVMRDNLAWDAVEDAMKSRDVDMPSNFQPEELCTMTKQDMVNARKNINSARDDLIEHMGEYFVPEHDDLLYEWLRDGKGYSAGRRVEAGNFIINPSSRA